MALDTSKSTAPLDTLRPDTKESSRDHVESRAQGSLEEMKKSVDTQKKLIQKVSDAIQEKPEDIQKALRYYELGEYEQAPSDTRAVEVLTKIRDALKKGKLERVGIIFLGGTDGTHHILSKLKEKGNEWHDDKKKAFKNLLSAAHIEPDSVHQFIERQRDTIQGYIDASDPYAYVVIHKNIFLKGGQLFDVALAFQRAEHTRLLFTDAPFSPKKEKVYLALSRAHGQESRKSGIMFEEVEAPKPIPVLPPKPQPKPVPAPTPIPKIVPRIPEATPPKGEQFEYRADTGIATWYTDSPKPEKYIFNVEERIHEPCQIGPHPGLFEQHAAMDVTVGGVVVATFYAKEGRIYTKSLQDRYQVTQDRNRIVIVYSDLPKPQPKPIPTPEPVIPTPPVIPKPQENTPNKPREDHESAGADLEKVLQDAETSITSLMKKLEGTVPTNNRFIRGTVADEVRQKRETIKNTFATIKPLLQSASEKGQKGNYEETLSEYQKVEKILQDSMKQDQEETSISLSDETTAVIKEIERDMRARKPQVQEAFQKEYTYLQGKIASSKGSEPQPKPKPKPFSKPTPKEVLGPRNQLAHALEKASIESGVQIMMLKDVDYDYADAEKAIPLIVAAYKGLSPDDQQRVTQRSIILGKKETFDDQEGLVETVPGVYRIAVDYTDTAEQMTVDMKDGIKAYQDMTSKQKKPKENAESGDEKDPKKAVKTKINALKKAYFIKKIELDNPDYKAILKNWANVEAAFALLGPSARDNLKNITVVFTDQDLTGYSPEGYRKKHEIGIDYVESPKAIAKDLENGIQEDD